MIDHHLIDYHIFGHHMYGIVGHHILGHNMFSHHMVGHHMFDHHMSGHHTFGHHIFIPETTYFAITTALPPHVSRSATGRSIVFDCLLHFVCRDLIDLANIHVGGYRLHCDSLSAIFHSSSPSSANPQPDRHRLIDVFRRIA